MNGIDDREKGFEAKYRLDEETRFKITARRNKLLGLWAADRMGLSGDHAGDYAKEVVMAEFAKPGDEEHRREHDRNGGEPRFCVEPDENRPEPRDDCGQESSD